MLRLHMFCKANINLKVKMIATNKDKSGLKEILIRDGCCSYSKMSKILAKIGNEKAQELGIIPKIHSFNGNKRLFRLEDIEEWMKR